MTEQILNDALKKVNAAKVFIMQRKPVYAAVLQRMETVVVPHGSVTPGGNKVITAVTDSYKNIWFSDKFVGDPSMTVANVAFLLIHELLHKMLKHGDRNMVANTESKEANRNLPNVAQDFIINSIAAQELGTANFPTGGKDHIDATIDTFWGAVQQSRATKKPLRLMDTGITDEMSAERIMQTLIETMPEPDQNGNGDGDNEGEGGGQGGQGGSSGGGGGQGGGNQGGGNQNQDDQGGNGDQNQDDQNQDDQNQDDNEQDLDGALDNRLMNDDTSEPPSEPDTGEGASSEDQAAEDARTASSVAQAIAANPDKNVGAGSARLNRIAEGMQQPSINPRALLEKYVRRMTSASDYSYRKPRKIGMDEDMILPTLRSEQLGELVVAIDTSGSVGNDELDQYASDIKAVARIMKPAGIRVIYCDSKVAGEQFFKKGHPVKLEPKGGGGTAFRPVFQHMKDESIKADLMLYLTDGYSWDFNELADLKPNFPVIWLHYEGDPDRFKPDFGAVVDTKIKRKGRY